jgi:hypothetical protein
MASPETLDVLIKTKKYLEKNMPQNNRDLNDYSYFLLLEDVCQCIRREQCSHIIESDLIDIDPDNSKTIYYCIKCESTFDTPKGGYLKTNTAKK